MSTHKNYLSTVLEYKYSSTFPTLATVYALQPMLRPLLWPARCGQCCRPRAAANAAAFAVVCALRPVLRPVAANAAACAAALQPVLPLARSGYYQCCGFCCGEALGAFENCTIRND